MRPARQPFRLLWTAALIAPALLFAAVVVRTVPGRDGDVLCTVAGAADLAVALREPVEPRLRDGSTLTARRLLISADAPRTARTALTRPVQEAGDR
ncbi:hypothetical protein H1R13_29440 [Streptomyces mexicanus]|uniref:Uncharacterized protein n=1 Tax=Streptomyces mexicanus TaxID=178566 RepID=A0A7X1I561_9ACTN|nr:hypothetical protein [Streptomyces mexicanus]MBC2868936.1 hypothetical protein [Streptomyces mexicanus]